MYRLIENNGNVLDLLNFDPDMYGNVVYPYSYMGHMNYTMVHNENTLVVIADPSQLDLKKKGGELIVTTKSKRNKMTVTTAKCLDNCTISLGDKFNHLKSPNTLTEVMKPVSIIAAILRENNADASYLKSFSQNEQNKSLDSFDNSRLSQPYSVFQENLLKVIKECVKNDERVHFPETYWQNEVSRFWGMMMSQRIFVNNVHRIDAVKMRNIWLQEYHEIKETWEMDGNKIGCRTREFPSETVPWEKLNFEGLVLWSMSSNMTTEGRRNIERKSRKRVHLQLHSMLKYEKRVRFSGHVFNIAKM